MLVEEPHERACGRSSSAKKADAALRISNVGPAQLSHLAAQPLDLGRLFGRDTRPLPGIHLRAAHPLAYGLRCRDAQLAGNLPAAGRAA
jgi:hypothetical protein